MTKYVCDICGKEVSGNDLCEDYMIMGDRHSLTYEGPYVGIDVCKTCKQKIQDNKDIVLKTICKAIAEWMRNEK